MCLDLNDLWMISSCMHSQSSFRPGNLSTDIAGVGDAAGVQVIGLNVCHYVCSLTFLSTNFTYLCSHFTFSYSQKSFAGFHQRFDLFIHLLDFFSIKSNFSEFCILQEFCNYVEGTEVSVGRAPLKANS